ncbi:hypothetical protein VTK56DRAFT_3636 [Thermocarpiscus australiensis]
MADFTCLQEVSFEPLPRGCSPGIVNLCKFFIFAIPLTVGNGNTTVKSKAVEYLARSPSSKRCGCDNFYVVPSLVLGIPLLKFVYLTAVVCKNIRRLVVTFGWRLGRAVFRWICSCRNTV